jgi:hypothetical protein
LDAIVADVASCESVGVLAQIPTLLTLISTSFGPRAFSSVKSRMEITPFFSR